MSMQMIPMDFIDVAINFNYIAAPLNFRWYINPDLCNTTVIDDKLNFDTVLRINAQGAGVMNVENYKYVVGIMSITFDWKSSNVSH